MKFKRLLTVVFLAFAVTACGADKEEVTEIESSKIRERETATAEPGTETESEPEASVPEAGPSLAKRLEGKYSYHTAGDNGEDEYLIMEVISFGDNLYAYCGQAIADESDELEAYSFWATEFIPDNASDLASPDAASADVTALNFSVMSNAGRYWNEGARGSISTDPGGIVFKDFGHDDFLVPGWDNSRLFLKDERVEDAFPYLKKDIYSGDGSLQGYWVNEDGDAPVYLKFEGNDVYIYQKKADGMVSFSAGGCDHTVKHFDCTANTLGIGDQPWNWSADYDVDGKTLTLDISGDELPGNLYGKTEFTKIDEKDVHVCTMNEIVFNDNNTGSYELSEGYVDDYANGFYGIWIAAEKDRDAAIEKAIKLYDDGFDSHEVYSPEWEGLNKDPYYCITAGRYYDENEAKKVLEDVKAAGYDSAYVKFTGAHKYVTVSYTNYGYLEAENNGDSVILKNVSFYVDHDWSIEEEYGETEYVSDLIIDKDTVFDNSCETEFFGNYENGDSPLDWYLKNMEYMENDIDRYLSNGPALSGIFRIGITGNHIDRYFGSYWWD